MQDELFTKEELDLITEEAKNLKYSVPNLYHIGSKKISIIGISQKNGLIMAYGNEWTGYKHINDRHSLASRIPYWDDKYKLGNPTKFSLNLPPIGYLFIASEIFRPENLKNSKNKRIELFDLYDGEYKHQDGQVIKYRLITYKETKIIHTLFVTNNNKPFNKKKILNLTQGYTYGSQNYYTGIQTYNWKYYDYNEIERYKIIIRFSDASKLEKWYIQVNSDEGVPFITTFIGERLLNVAPSSIVDKAVKLDFENIEWVEGIIKLMMEGKYKF